MTNLINKKFVELYDDSTIVFVTLDNIEEKVKVDVLKMSIIKREKKWLN